MRRAFLPVLLMAPSLGGCIVGSVAKTAVDVVSIPVKVVGAGVDAATTSQSEADEKRGRALRKEAERCARRRTLPGDLCPAPAVR